MKTKGIVRTVILSVILAVLSMNEASAQKVAVKTNVLYWATASPNLSVEIGLAPKWTLDLGGGVNPFTFKENRKWKHYQWQGEARYWFCERFYRHFLGIHAGGGEFNVSRMPGVLPKFSEEYRYEGWAAKAGISYGYSFVLGGRWNLEATLGLGVVYADYDKFGCSACGDRIGSGAGLHFAPTKAGITFIYMIR
jgi:hypothetical protein